MAPAGVDLELWARIRAGPRERISSEVWWSERQQALLSRGYALRPRYHQTDWQPTWDLPGNEDAYPHRFEDSHYIPGRGNVLDATRIADNVKVVLKAVKWPEEIDLTRRFGQKLADERRDSNNHCIPLLDIIYPAELVDKRPAESGVPENGVLAILVLPFLRQFDDPRFKMLSEVTEALGQFLQGMEYLHANHVAHRDLCHGNLMMDAAHVIPKGWHFAAPYSHTGFPVGLQSKPRHSVSPVAYFIIDFGLSTQFPPHVSLEAARDVGRYGQDKTVPELSDTVPYNPFKVDIYQLGNVIMKLVETYEKLEIFRGLAESMTRHNPEDRPTASECMEVFNGLMSTTSEDAPVYCLVSSDSEDSDYESEDIGSNRDSEAEELESASEADPGDDWDGRHRNLEEGKSIL